VPRQGDFVPHGAYTLLMGSTALLIALFTIGYFTGVWTAILVLRRPQHASEEELSRPGKARSPDQIQMQVLAWPVELEA
jgi:hypothetical protein